MGNCCSSSQDEEGSPAPILHDNAHFAGQGRTLGPSPAGAPNVPSSQPGAQDVPVITTPSTQPPTQNDARSAAAKAAEERLASAAAQNKGKLGQALAKEKGQTRNATLAAASEEERRRREIDDATSQRNYS